MLPYIVKGLHNEAGHLRKIQTRFLALFVLISKLFRVPLIGGMVFDAPKLLCHFITHAKNRASGTRIMQAPQN